MSRPSPPRAAFWQGNRRAGIKDHLRQCGICAGLDEDKAAYIWANLGASAFDEGAAQGFSQTVMPFKEYAIAGVKPMDHLAELTRSQHDQVTLRRHALALAEWRGDRPEKIEIKLCRMLEQHAEEWRNFVLSMGPDSFAKRWTRAAA